MTIGRSSATSKGRQDSMWAQGIRCVVCGLIALMTMQGTFAAAQQEPSRQAPASQSRPVTQPQTISAPPMMPDDMSVNADLSSLPSAPLPQSPASEQQTPAQQPGNPQQPVGTAAAPYEKPTGVPGSSPAGAVIAPAKQRRVRAIVIRVSIVLAAGAAVGAVVGLSRASHSQP
jgi:hypothetical protein